MKTVEASAKTREEAIQNALDELGVEMYEVDDIEIVDEGSKGIFGLGARPVRVKVKVEKLPGRPQRPNRKSAAKQRDRRDGAGGGRKREPAKRQNRSDDRKPRQDRKQPSSRSDSSETKGNRSERDRNRPKRAERDKRNPRRTEENEGRSPNRTDNDKRRKDRRDKRENGEARRPSRPPRGERNQPQEGRKDRRAERSRDAENSRPEEGERRPPRPRRERKPEEVKVEQAEVKGDVETPAVVESAQRQEEESYATLTDAQGSEAAALLKDIVSKMAIEAEVEFARAEDGTARLNVSSEDGAILIGRKGRNLSAMQYLINRMVARGDSNESSERIVVDVEGYVDRRKNALEEMALALAQKAKDLQRNMRLKPMTPQERRIIHLALQNDTEVRTYSLGDSLYRSIIISPRNARQDRGRGGRGRNGRGREQQSRRQRDDDFDAGQFGD